MCVSLLVANLYPEFLSRPFNKALVTEESSAYQKKKDEVFANWIKKGTLVRTKYWSKHTQDDKIAMVFLFQLVICVLTLCLLCP